MRSKKISLPIILSFLLPIASFAQSVVIDFVHDSFSFDDLEGALVLPHAKDQPTEILKALVPSTSKDGSAATTRGGGGRWTISKTRGGTYSFYIGNTAGQPDSEWDPSLKVQVRSPGGNFEFRPPQKRGSVWHVFDIDGSDGSVAEVGKIYPAMRLVWGFVRDAAKKGPDGKAAPLEGVRVDLFGKAANAVVASAVTGKSGAYVLAAPEGIDFSISFAKAEFIDYKDLVRFMVNEYPQRIDAAMSNLLLESQYRAVLNWGASPSDLDSHLRGPTPEGGEFHISYRNMKEYGRRHNLDMDCTSGYGPETITITRLDKGIYSYAVHDYSNLASASSGKMSGGKPVVRLYREKELIATFECPEGASGTLWRVFQIDGATGELKAINAMGFESDPNSVR